MNNRKVSSIDYERYKKKKMEESMESSWVRTELDMLREFKVITDREEVFLQIIQLNKLYKTRLSRGHSKAPDECGELADYIASEAFQSRVMTEDKVIAISLVVDLARAAKTRGRFLLSFASKYCHHCNPNMFPIYDSVNVDYLKKHYSYIDKRDYKEYMDVYSLFCRDIDVDLSCADSEEGFFVDKFINNLQKQDKN